MKTPKKILSLLLAAALCISTVPTTAFAENSGAQDSGVTIGASGLCEHHTEHTADCGYTEGTPETACTHEHGAECYPDSVSGSAATPTEAAEPTNCTHTEHTADCGYAPAVEGTAEIPCTHEHDDSCGYVPASEGVEETPCTHEHDEGCGYVPAAEGTPEMPCAHEHGAECYPDSVSGNEATTSDAAEPTNCTHAEHTADCGYAPAVEGTPCGYVCEICNPTVKTITAWAWNDEYELIVDGGIGLIWDSVAWDDLAPMLPSITAVIGEAEEILTLDCSCADVADGMLTAGTHTLTAALPEGYALGEDVPALTLTLEMGGGAVFAGETGDFIVTGDDLTGVSYSEGVLTINTGKPITISNTNPDTATTNRIEVAASIEGGANITLQNVNISTTAANAIKAESALNLTIEGQNTLEAKGVVVTYGFYDPSTGNTYYNYSDQGVIYSSGDITIGGTGELNVAPTDTTNGYGIYSDTGGVTVSGGTVTATGGSTGIHGSGGVTIEGAGTVVNATSDYYGISNSSGSITISSGTVTAKGTYGICGRGNGGVTISGGTVTATGGTCGIYGSGSGGSGGVKISGTGTVVNATGGEYGIYHINSGNIDISGGFVVAKGATAIGGHANSSGSINKNNGVVIENTAGTVYGSPTITGTATIPAGATLTIPDGKTLTVNGTLTINGTISGGGTIDCSGGGTITGIIPQDIKVQYSVTTSLTGISSNGAATANNKDSYTATLTADSGYELPNSITVTIGGTNFANHGYTKENHTITIPANSINGNIVITAAGVSPLTAPQNLQWDSTTPGKATWNAVANASSYSVQLYKDGTAEGAAVSVEAGTTEHPFDFSNPAAGSYTFKVKAISNNANYTNSLESAASGELVFYTVIWQNEGTTIETDVVVSGDTPTYNGTTPTKADDGTYTYTHSGWTPSVGAITRDTTYTATYSKAYLAPAAGTGYTINYADEKATAESGYEISLNGSTWSGGPLDITPGGTLYVRKAATTGNDPVNASAATQNTLDLRPAAPTGISGVNESWQGDDDGQITGLTANGSYQISFNNGVWQDKTADASGNITGLAAGSYKIRIVADTSNKKFASEAADVTIATGPARTYTLNVTAPTFDPVTYGDNQPEAKPITISSTGNSDATITGVALSGAGAGSFTLNKTDGTTITAGATDSTTYTVQPNAGLGKGTYTATVTVTYNGDTTATATVTFVVNGLTQAAPAAPELESRTTSSITLKEIAPNANGAAAEYRMNGGAWQTSRTFSGLSSNTSYSFEARYAATGNYEASPASSAVSIATNGSGGGGGGGGYDDGDDDYTPPTPPIVQPETSESDGWSEIRAELRSARPGDTIVVKMNGATVVPKEVSREIAGKDVTVIFDMGGSVSWTVNGQDIPQSIGNLDLGIKTNSNTIPVSVINAITGEITTMQFELSHSGPFGTILHLTLNVGRENSGYWANLYHLNGKELVFQYASRIDRTGKASWPFDHASSYAVVIDEESHDPDGDKTNPNTGAGNPFTDVKDTDWFYEDVLFVYESGIMLGTSDTTFSPNGTATRGMMATVLWRMEGSPEPSGKNPFTDVPDSEYYADAITWANEQGIFVGYGGGMFGPNDPITREQLATIFYRYAEYKGYDLTPTDSLNRFTDKGKIADWAQYAVKWAVGSGLMFGTTDTTFAPKTTATRAQIAAMIHRFIEKYGLTEGVTATGLTGWIKPDLTLPPQTGDYSNSGLWAGIAMLSAGGGASTIAVYRRKRRKDEDDHLTPA